MQTDALNKKFADEYLATLTSRDVPHERTYIIFSGVPGSGKTTLAQWLAHDLKAQYIRHDGYNVGDFTVSRISALVIDTILAEDQNKLNFR